MRIFLCFFSGKSPKVCSRLNWIFRGFNIQFFFQIQSISIVKKKANSIIEQQKSKSHEKRDRLLISQTDNTN